MQAEKPQFDCFLGGSELLPPRITFSSFAAARAKEIQIMTNFLNTQSSTKLAFQKLPKHLRRRAMSHNAKRLPRRLRQIHLNQMQKSGLPPKQKRPSRKFRRRPKNLMEDYFRRQMRVKWLRTHIWHAKRFHMVEKWGYKLPDSPCEKAFRACYRATSKHCLMQDISYYHCIELVGNYQVIVNGFKLLTDPTTGLSVGAKAFAHGNREGSITLFKPRILPRVAIGLVYFHWKPLNCYENERKLWLWIHIAYYSEVMSTLTECFELNLVQTENPCYINSVNGVKLFERHLELNRIRLTGPLSNAVLQETFKLVQLDTKMTWLNEYIAQVSSNKTNIIKQNEFWEQLKVLTSIAAISPHIILSLLVEDPRYNLPKKRTKALSKNSEENIKYLDTPQYVAISPIWEQNYRTAVKDSKLSNAQVNELRSKIIVPDSSLGNGPAVPVLLVQRPGNKTDNLGYGSGWDIIIPSEWTQNFWLAFIMRGAKVGGLQQNSLINFEMGKTDILLPDTSAGNAEETNLSKACKEQFFKKPPNKRINYNKFAIASPLEWSWEILINDWNRSSGQSSNNYSVIRDRNQLMNIREFISSKARNVPDCSPNCLIPIKLKCQKGSLRQFAIICLPQNEDYKKEPLEPKIEDKFKEERKETRRNHLTLLKKLRRKRIKAKESKIKKIPIDKEMLMEYTKKMRSLWLPQPTNIRNSCSREVIGIIRTGGFSLTTGQSAGVGFIASNVLSSLVKLNKRNKVLVRNTNTRQYRLAEIDVITE